MSSSEVSVVVENPVDSINDESSVFPYPMANSFFALRFFLYGCCVLLNILTAAFRWVDQRSLAFEYYASSINGQLKGQMVASIIIVALCLIPFVLEFLALSSRVGVKYRMLLVRMSVALHFLLAFALWLNSIILQTKLYDSVEGRGSYMLNANNDPINHWNIWSRDRNHVCSMERGWTFLVYEIIGALIYLIVSFLLLLDVTRFPSTASEFLISDDCLDYSSHRRLFLLLLGFLITAERWTREQIIAVVEFFSTTILTKILWKLIRPLLSVFTATWALISCFSFHYSGPMNNLDSFSSYTLFSWNLAYGIFYLIFIVISFIPPLVFIFAEFRLSSIVSRLHQIELFFVSFSVCSSALLFFLHPTINGDHIPDEGFIQIRGVFHCSVALFCVYFIGLSLNFHQFIRSIVVVVHSLPLNFPVVVNNCPRICRSVDYYIESAANRIPEEESQNSALPVNTSSSSIGLSVSSSSSRSALSSRFEHDFPSLTSWFDFVGVSPVEVENLRNSNKIVNLLDVPITSATIELLPELKEKTRKRWEYALSRYLQKENTGNSGNEREISESKEP